MSLEGQSQLGEVLKLMPTMKEIIQKKVPSIEMPETEWSLKLLLKLKLPTNRQYKPMKIEAIKQCGALPPYFERDEICECEAKKVWNELCTKFPDLRVIEKIPLLEPEPEGWHETLLAKIFEHNKWARKVVKAKALVDFKWPEDVPVETRKRRKIDHQSSLKDFWAREDPSGSDKVSRAAEISAQWQEDAKKNEKKEGEMTKDVEADEMDLVEDLTEADIVF